MKQVKIIDQGMGKGKAGLDSDDPDDMAIQRLGEL